jgi:hypothetical protein
VAASRVSRVELDSLTVKLLWLGNSNDVQNNLPKERRAPYLTVAKLEEALGLDIDINVRGFWPSERLPGLVEAWMEEFKPDLVFLQIIDYAFTYESVPLKLDRKFGRLSKPAVQAGTAASNISWISSTPVYHIAKRLAKDLIGGSTYFSPEEVLQRVSACVRVILRNEDAALLVRGPHAATDHYGTAKRRTVGEAKRLVVHSDLQQLCEELHVLYHGLDRPAYEDIDNLSRLGDRLHFDDEANVAYVQEIADWLIRAWVQHHPEFRPAERGPETT